MKIFLKGIIIVVCSIGMLLIVVVGYFVWLIDSKLPDAEPKIVRDSRQSTILATFQVIPCGDGTAHMRLPSSIPDIPGPGLEIYVPHGLPHPEEQDEIGVSGNQFKLTGFLYRTEWHDKNSRTVIVDPPHRIDLTAWEILAPYEVWVPATDDKLSTETHTAPIKFTGPLTITTQVFTSPFKYSGC